MSKVPPAKKNLASEAKKSAGDSEPELDYYEMTSLERQEWREQKANGGKKVRRPKMPIGMYPPMGGNGKPPKMDRKLATTGSVGMAE